MRKTSALLITAILLSLPFCFNITTVRASSSSESGSGASSSSSTDSDTSNIEAVSGDLKKHLIGYWRSIQKSDLGDSYLYQAFSETGYIDTGSLNSLGVVEWISYKVVGVNGNELTFDWSQDTGALGQFNRRTRITFLSDKKIRIDYNLFSKDRFSKGPVYEKISEEQWLKDKEGLDNAAIQQLRQKMGETIKQSEN